MTIDIPPMPDHPPTVGVPATTNDWWERLYGTEAETRPAGSQATPIEPARDGGSRRRLGLIPDWRQGPITDLSPEADPDIADAGSTQTGAEDTPDTDTADQQDTDAAHTDTEQDDPDDTASAPVLPTLSDTASEWIRGIHTPHDEEELDNAGTGLIHRVQAATRRRSTRRALYFGTAAYAGWTEGIPQWIHHHISALGTEDSISTALYIGGLTIGASLVPAVIARRIGARIDALITFALREDHHLRVFDPALGWVGSIPLASSMLALALYTPGSPIAL